MRKVLRANLKRTGGGCSIQSFFFLFQGFFVCLKKFCAGFCLAAAIFLQNILSGSSVRQVFIT